MSILRAPKRILFAAALFTIFTLTLFSLQLAPKQHILKKYLPLMVPAAPSTLNKGDQHDLSKFLGRSKTDFIDALTRVETWPNILDNWVLVVGNEAGDLDSVASAIELSFLYQQVNPDKRYVPLMQIYHKDLELRPENIEAIAQALDIPDKKLDQGTMKQIASKLCLLDDLEDYLPLPTTASWALVDHNQLSPRFSQAEEPNVVAIFDHHEDTGAHSQAPIRSVINPAGSCVSVISSNAMFSDYLTLLPRGIADLVISAIVIDTGNLKIGGKATELDHAVFGTLLPMSDFGGSPDPKLVISNYFDTLSTLKNSLDHLSIEGLLRRDFKDYYTETSTNGRTVHWGLASSSVSLSHWLEKARAEGSKNGDSEQDAWKLLWNKIEAWSTQEGNKFDLLGVLTSFHGLNHKGNEKHQRELLILVNNPDLELILTDLQNNPSLELKEWTSDRNVSIQQGPSSDINKPHHVWKQGNAKMTRKQVAPIITKTLTESNSL